MRMKKAISIALLLALCLCAACALATDQRVFDQGNLLSATEKTALEQAIVQFQKDTGMDFVLVTSTASHGEIDQQTIADDFYDKYGFGLDGERSGVLYYIDLYERAHWLSTTGKMIDYMTDERIDDAIDACAPYLTSGRYGDGAKAMLGKVQGYLRAGIPEGQYQYDVVTGRQLTPRHKALTQNEMLFGAAIALLVGFFFSLVVKRRYQLKGSTYQYDFRSNVQLRMTDTDDTYLRSATTRMPKAPPPSSGGGGGFGGGGGSGVHTGSSGTSHGGGGGRF